MIAKMTQLLAALRRDERGLTTVEYAIVLCLIAAMAVMTWREFGEMVDEKLSDGTEKISDELDKGL